MPRPIEFGFIGKQPLHPEKFQFRFNADGSATVLVQAAPYSSGVPGLSVELAIPKAQADHLKALMKE